MPKDFTYHHLTHHLVAGPQNFSYFIPLILLPTALLIPRNILSRWMSIAIFMPAIALASIDAWRAMNGVDVISVNAVLWSLYLLVLKDPWKDFGYVSSDYRESVVVGSEKLSNGTKDKSGDEISNTANKHSIRDEQRQLDETPYPPTLLPRLLWVFTLLTSIRLNNWRIGLSSHDKHQPSFPAFATRSQFLIQALMSLSSAYLILDLTSAYTSHDPYFHKPNISISSPLPSKVLNFLPPQLLRTMVVGLQAWTLISQMFYLPCLLPVGLNALGLWPDDWSPHNWAAYFGPPSAIFEYGVRGFWGRYWHQTMRISCSGPGYAIAEYLRLREGGLLRYAVITIVAFGLSGIVHVGIVPPEPLQATVGVEWIRLCVAGFFWLQPVAMLIEVVAIRLLGWIGILEKFRRSRIRLAFNAVWVVCWFALCIPLLAEAGRQLGYGRDWLVPFSLWKAIRGEDYVAWPFLKNIDDLTTSYRIYGIPRR